MTEKKRGNVTGTLAHFQWTFIDKSMFDIVITRINFLFFNNILKSYRN